MSGNKRAIDPDPDYAGFEINPDEDMQAKRAKIIEENAREAAVEKIQAIVDEEFTKEIELKEQELMAVNQKLTEARCIMDRLRACVVASFYAASFTKPVDGAKGPEAGAAYHPAIQNVMRKAVTTVLSKKEPPNTRFTSKFEESYALSNELDNAAKSETDSVKATCEETETSNSNQNKEDGMPDGDKEESLSGKGIEEKSKVNLPNLGGRQRIKKTIVVGNVSKYISPDKREGSDKSTHKWMVYVRGGKEEPRIDHFVRKVWFFLHPSYRPNDLVEVCEAPFHLTRRGWGEFPIRVQIHFLNRQNRPVDIIHELRLDRTYTGLQTLGAETVCKVEIDQSAVHLNVDEMLALSDLRETPEDSVAPSCSSNVFRERREQSPILKKTKMTREKIVNDSAEIEDSVMKDDSGDPDIAESSTKETAVDNKKEGLCIEEGSKIEETPTMERKRKRRRKDICRKAEEENGVHSGVQEECVTIAISESREITDNSACSPVKYIKCDIDNSKPEAGGSSDQSEGGKTDSSVQAQEANKGNASSLSSYAEMPTLRPLSGTEPSNELEKIVAKNSNKDSREEKNGHQTSESDLKQDELSSPTCILKPQQKFMILSPVKEGSGPKSEARQQFVIVTKSSENVDNNFKRLRSVSDGEHTQAIPDSPSVRTNLMKSGHSVTPVLNVKIQTPAESPKKSPTKSPSASPLRRIIPCPSLQKYIVIDGKQPFVSPIKGIASQSQIILPPDVIEVGRKQQIGMKSTVLLPQKQTITIKKESGSSITDPKQGHVTIPLSSLIKASALSSQASNAKGKMHTFTIAQSSQGSFISLKPVYSSAPSATLSRQKRSLSADCTPKCTISLAPSNFGKLDPKSSGHLSNQTLQLRIVDASLLTKPQQKSSIKNAEGPVQPAKHRLKQTPQGLVLLENLTKKSQNLKITANPQMGTVQAGPSSGTTNRSVNEVPSKTMKQVDLIPQQQYVLATVVTPKGKQQLALINPSNLTFANVKKSVPAQTVPQVQSPRKSPSIPQQKQPRLTFKNLKGLTSEKKRQQEALAILNKLLPEPVYKVIGDSIHHENLQSLEAALHLVTKHVPLVYENRRITEFPFCAKTESNFLDWNVGKQRAAEWQRALLIRRVLKYLQTKTKDLQKFKIPNKKFIVHWCVKHGYSVFTDEYEHSDESKEDEKNTLKIWKSLKPSLISYDELMQEIQIKIKVKIQNDKINKKVTESDSDDLIIDVVSIEPPSSTAQQHLEIKQEFLQENELNESNDHVSIVTEATESKIDMLKTSGQIEVIDEMVRKIGIEIPSCEMPLTKIVLAKAMQIFVDRLTRCSLAAALERRDGKVSVQRVAPDEIQVLDVAESIQNHSELEFITDKSFAEGCQPNTT